MPYPDDSKEGQFIFERRFFATVQDEVARRRKLEGGDVEEARQMARRYRTQADLVEQGVPIERALSALPQPTQNR